MPLFAEGGQGKHPVFDKLTDNVLIHPDPHGVPSSENSQQWKRALPNIIKLMSVWSHTQEII